MKLMQNGSVKLLLAIATAAPGLLIVAPASQAVGPALGDTLKQEVRTAAPFIDSEARYNTLERLQTTPVQDPGLIMRDGGTGKEASDPKIKESKDGKESCESGNCGGLFIPSDFGREVINPVQMEDIQQMEEIQQQHSELPSQLLQSQQPII
jgi:hypothetical protein